MRRKRVRLAVLLFMLFNILLAACAQGAPANTPAPTPEPTPEYELIVGRLSLDELLRELINTGSK